MNSYLGKICPYCKTEFKLGDDIVICSNCEMPHHKECWVDNGGCTTFGCNGTIQDISNKSVEDNKEIEYESTNVNSYDLMDNYCPRCGSKRNLGDIFCGSCGYNYSAYKETTSNITSQYNIKTTEAYKDSSTNSQNFSSQSVHTIIDYADDNREYYGPQFDTIESGGRPSFNWGAFFFDVGWMAYRKMYKRAFVFSIIEIVFSFFGVIGKIAVFALKLYIGFAANKMYYNQIEGYTIKESRLSESERNAFYQKKKGASILSWLLFWVIVYASIFAIAYLLGSSD